MTRQRAAWIAAGVLAVLWSTYLLWPRRPLHAGVVQATDLDATVAPSSPHVVLVIGCTVRKDQVTPYGGPDTTTPFLDSLARQGARFGDTLSTSAWTREAAVSLLTGHHAASLGMVEPAEQHSRRVLPDEAETLAELLQQAGWYTVGLTANPNLNQGFGFGQGFEVYRDAGERGFAQENKVPGGRLVRRALTLLDRRAAARGAKPLFLQLTLIDPHQPRVIRKEALARHADPNVSSEVVAYRALLRRMDDALRLLETGLQQRGIDPSNTLWVFVADHGEGLSMPAHHMPAHGKRMYASTVEVPWIVRGPGIPAGRVIGGLASGVDVVPTLASFLELSTAAQGRDWSDQLRGHSERTDRATAFALSMFLNANLASMWTTDRQCQSGFGAWTEPPEGVDWGCFDRASDPMFHEARPDAAAMATIAAWRSDRLAEGRRGVEAAPLDPDLTRQLEALGYRTEASEQTPR